MSEYRVIPEKPNISLYIGRKVERVYRLPDTEEWEWYIELTGGVLIRNYSKQETHMPSHIEGMTLRSFAMSQHDTTLHLENPASHVIERWGLKPTSYTIHDPQHGGEVSPQWPEELEERGIAPQDVGAISDTASEGWPQAYEGLTKQSEVRATDNAEKFLEDE